MYNNDIFQLANDGFFYSIDGIEKKVSWNEIDKIIAYKKDLFTTDLVCVDITHNTTIITLTEELVGWDIFVKTMGEKLPLIDPDWEWKVIQPPFETNLITIFKK